MIVDSTKNLSKYACLHPRFEAAIKFFEELMAQNVPDGKYFMPNADVENGVYVSIFTDVIETKQSMSAESHVKYIDIQVVLTGGEEMCVPSVKIPDVTVEYDEQKDIIRYAELTREGCHVCNVGAGSFVIFFDGELHMPGASAFGDTSTVRKAVIKVLA